EAIDQTLSNRRGGLYPLVNFPVGQVTPLHVSSTSRASHATPPPPAGPGSSAPALRPAPGSPARFQLPRWPSGSRDGRPARARLARWPPGSPTPAPAPPTAGGVGRGRQGARGGGIAPARALAGRLTPPRPGSPHGGRCRRRAHGSTRWRYGHVVLPGALPRHRENAAGRPHLSGTAPRRTRSEGAQHPLTAAPSPEVGA